MSYLVASALLASNYLRATQRVPSGGSGENRAMSKACEIAWLSHTFSTETGYGESTVRIA